MRVDKRKHRAKHQAGLQEPPFVLESRLNL